MELSSASIFSANWSYRSEMQKDIDFNGSDSFPIVECLSCRFLYAGLLPPKELLDFIYDKVIDDVKARNSNFSLHSLANRMNYLSTLMSLLADGSEETSILDFGCGFGPTLQLLNGIHTVKAVGFETSEVRLQELSARNLSATGDILELGRRAPFSAVILDNVLEHLPDPAETLRLVRQWCRPGALLYVGVPDANRTYMRKQQSAVLLGNSAAMDINPWEHLNYFDLKHLDQLLRKAGFLPLRQAELPESVSVGLRPEVSAMERLKNSVASVGRMLRYVHKGDASTAVTRRFYRLAS